MIAARLKLESLLGKGVEIPSDHFKRTGSILRSMITSHSVGSTKARRRLEETLFPKLDKPDDGRGLEYRGQEFQPLPSGLEDEADQIIALSPSLRRRLTQVQYDGWSIGYAKSPVLSYADHSAKAIIIDPNMGAPEAVGEMAHWIAHVHRSNWNLWYPPRQPDQNTTQWAQSATSGHLLGEVRAAMQRCQVRREILQQGGPDIGADNDLALQWFESYSSGDIPWTEAQMSLLLGLGRQSSFYPHSLTDPTMRYEDALREFYTMVAENHGRRKQP